MGRGVELFYLSRDLPTRRKTSKLYYSLCEEFVKTRPHRTPSFFTVFGVWHACLRANTLHLKHTYLMPIHVCIFNVCAYLCLYVLCIWNMVTVLCRHPIIKKCVPCECHFHFLWPYLHRMYCLVCPLSGCYPAKSAVFTLSSIWGHPVGRRANCNCQLQR